jgi:hypothetical protein
MHPPVYGWIGMPILMAERALAVREVVYVVVEQIIDPI